MLQKLCSLFARWKKGELKEIIDDFRWLLRYSARFKGRIALCTVLNMLQTSFGLVSAVAGKYTLDIITGYDRARLWQVVVIMLASAVVSLALNGISGRVALKTRIAVTNQMEEDAFTAVMDADWLTFNRYPNGDILNRFRGDITSSAQYAINWLPNLIGSVYGFAAALVVILHYDAVMALIALASAPFTFLVTRRAIRRTREYSIRQRKISSVLFSFESEVFQNYDTIKALSLGPSYRKQLKTIQQDNYSLSMESNLYSIKTGAYVSAIRSAFYFIAFGYCLFRLWTGDITFGTMNLFMQQRGSLGGSFSGVADTISSLMNTSVSAGRIRELTELPKEPCAAAFPDGEIPKKAAVTVKNVSFSYPEGGGEEEELRYADFKAYPGEIVALTGTSGEGKTTLLRLVLALIRPGDGAVSFEMGEGESAPADAGTRRMISYVPQGNSIVAGTIEDNLRMGREDATESEMIAALQDACAWDYVKNLPGRLQYALAERGKGLSEGQAQRIAIARALLRPAPILLLDELTSALDWETEKKILENISRDRGERTIIISAHRPSVLAVCDRVYSIRDGRITEIPAAQAAEALHAQ